MRRVLPFLVLLPFAAPASWASSHPHSGMAAHTHTLTASAPVRTHAPGIFPRMNAANLDQTIDAHPQAFRESSLGAFLVRTMLGFSSRFGQ